MPFVLPVLAAVGGGSAVAGGIAAGSAALGAGASIYAANQQKGAAKDALNAETAAQAQARADAEKATQRVTDLQQPYMQGGNAAYQALLTQYGLQPAQQGPAQPDYGAYGAANPDVQAWASADGDPSNDAAQLAEHYQQYGKTEGRQLPTTGGQPANPFTWNPPTNFGTQPNAPSFLGLPTADISERAFQQSPLYNLGLKEGQGNLNANFGARGLLRSGAAVQGALDFARENVKNNYGTFAQTALSQNSQAQNAAQQANNNNYNLYTQETNQFNNNRNFDSSQYAAGLNYLTNRYDNNTNNLFNLANTGRSAATAIGEAAQGFAGTSGNLALQGAQSQGAYAGNVGNANINLGNDLAGIGQNIFRSAGGTGGGTLTPVQPSSPAYFGSGVMNPYSNGIPVF